MLMAAHYCALRNMCVKTGNKEIAAKLSVILLREAGTFRLGDNIDEFSSKLTGW